MRLCCVDFRQVAELVEASVFLSEDWIDKLSQGTFGTICPEKREGDSIPVLCGFWASVHYYLGPFSVVITKHLRYGAISKVQRFLWLLSRHWEFLEHGACVW